MVGQRLVSFVYSLFLRWQPPGSIPRNRDNENLFAADDAIIKSC